MCTGNAVAELWMDLISMGPPLISKSICLTGLALIKTSSYDSNKHDDGLLSLQTGKVEGT